MKDVTEFLAEAGLTHPLTEIRARVTYQDSCHLLHGQKVKQAPRTLLNAIPGLQFTELPHSDLCCGSAGIYNVLETDISLRLLRDKMEYANSTRAEIIATSNPGCLLQLRAGVARHGTGQEVVHVIELLDRASS